MIWTLQIVTIFLTMTSDASTVSMRRTKMEHDSRIETDHILPKFSSEALPNRLKNIDSVNIYNRRINQESSFSKNNSHMLYKNNINNSLQKNYGESKKTQEQIAIIHHIDQNPRKVNENKVSTYPFSFLDFSVDKKEPEILVNSSKAYVHSSNDLITPKEVFPEEQFSLDVLTSVQREGIYGFPKPKNQQFILKKNIQTTRSTLNHNLGMDAGLDTSIPAEKHDKNIESETAVNKENLSNDENHFTTEKFTTVPPSIFVNEIKEAETQELIKTSIITKTSPVINLLFSAEKYDTNIESQTTTEEDYALLHENDSTTEISTELSMRLVDEIKEEQVSATQEHKKSSNLTKVVTLPKELESKRSVIKTLVSQKEEDEIRIKDAKYNFSTSQNDGISDLRHERTETRQDGKVIGSYTYSDGFLLRKVNYVADKDGYRIVSEDTLILPGKGPKLNPEGTADIKTDVDGHRLHYVVHGKELPQRTSRLQGNGKMRMES